MSDHPEDDVLRAVAHLHDETDARFRQTTAQLPIACASGCSDCCQDHLTVWRVEAERIVRYVQENEAQMTLHPAGACVWLDPRGRCQVYEARPYVCRSQGAVLRWQQDDGERRATCERHEPLIPLERLSLNQTFELGPAEGRLLTLATRWHAERGAKGLPERVDLRRLAEQIVGGSEPRSGER